ncbi:MAG TPA: glycosyltransferase family 39 protein, partial [Tepidisphaeraceae bacterium]|nr:glycosyltransferase family 39 protein [Tepidisphaeraceae bacterium]
MTTAPTISLDEDTRRIPAWIVALGFLLITCVTYIPAFNANFIWDDPDYVVNNTLLRSVKGLKHFWTSRDATPQFYPATFTSFWIEFQLYDALGLGTPRPGLWAPGYHVTNVLLHALGGFLLWRVLKQLAVPAALLAALVWTVHPLQVESVAWITERKNTLSAVFYFGAALAFLRHRPLESNRVSFGKWWWISFGLFALALLSKSVTASLPAALLVVAWWKTGRVSRANVVQLIPFFVIALVAGANTASIERGRVGASGPEWDYASTTAGEFFHRSLIAGRALWFYATKIIAPYPLAFIYERWDVSIRSAGQWIFPISAIGIVGALALLTFRKRIGRGPLACILFFAGTIFPAIGFFNVYPHRYSFVADHFQHLAGIGLIVLICAMIVQFVSKKSTQIVIGSILILVLSAMSFAHSLSYQSFTKLWTDTLKKSPNSWMVHVNYGHAMRDEDRDADARAAYERALALKRNPETLQNVASSMLQQNDFANAKPLLLEAEQLDPRYILSTLTLAGLLAEEGDLVGATLRITRVLDQTNDTDPDASRRLGEVFIKQSRLQTDDRERLSMLSAAIAAYRNAVTYAPESVMFRRELGDLLIETAVLENKLGLDGLLHIQEARHNYEQVLV